MLFQTERMNGILKSIYERLKALEDFENIYPKDVSKEFENQREYIEDVERKGTSHFKQILQILEKVQDLSLKLKIVDHNTMCNLRMIQEVQKVTKEHQEFINDYLDDLEDEEEDKKPLKACYGNKFPIGTREEFTNDLDNLVIMYFAYGIKPNDDSKNNCKEMKDKFVKSWGPR